MTSDGDSNQEINVRIGQARTAIKQLNSLLWSPRKTKNNKIRIYITIVKSRGYMDQNCGKLIKEINP